MTIAPSKLENYFLLRREFVWLVVRVSLSNKSCCNTVVPADQFFTSECARSGFFQIWYVVAKRPNESSRKLYLRDRPMGERGIPQFPQFLLYMKNGQVIKQWPWNVPLAPAHTIRIWSQGNNLSRAWTNWQPSWFLNGHWNWWRSRLSNRK